MIITRQPQSSKSSSSIIRPLLTVFATASTAPSQFPTTSSDETSVPLPPLSEAVFSARTLLRNGLRKLEARTLSSVGAELPLLTEAERMTTEKAIGDIPRERINLYFQMKDTSGVDWMAESFLLEKDCLSESRLEADKDRDTVILLKDADVYFPREGDRLEEANCVVNFHSGDRAYLSGIFLDAMSRWRKFQWVAKFVDHFNQIRPNTHYLCRVTKVRFDTKGEYEMTIGPSDLMGTIFKVNTETGVVSFARYSVGVYNPRRPDVKFIYLTTLSSPKPKFATHAVQRPQRTRWAAVLRGARGCLGRASSKSDGMTLVDSTVPMQRFHEDSE